MTSIQFNQGVMMLSDYDSLSRQSRVRTLTLPEKPALQPLDIQDRSIPKCQSISTEHKPSFTNSNKSRLGGEPIRLKRTLSGALHAVTDLIFKSSKRVRSQQTTEHMWNAETWTEELRSSTDYTNRASSSDNWWLSTPSINAY